MMTAPSVIVQMKAYTASYRILEGQQQYPLLTRRNASLVLQSRTPLPVDAFVEPAFYSAGQYELHLSVDQGTFHLPEKITALSFHHHRKLQKIPRHVLSAHLEPIVVTNSTRKELTLAH